jgi:hypothetical protein
MGVLLAFAVIVSLFLALGLFLVDRLITHGSKERR